MASRESEYRIKTESKIEGTHHGGNQNETVWGKKTEKDGKKTGKIQDEGGVLGGAGVHGILYSCAVSSGSRDRDEINFFQGFRP